MLASCSFIGEGDGPLSAVNPKGTFSQRIDNLFWPVFWIATTVFVLVAGAILVAVILFHDRDGRKGAKQFHGSPRLEVLWTVIPTLILAGIAVPTIAAVFDLTECGANAIEIDVIGHQWWFEFHYPDADVTTANVMVIPTGQEVCANLTSTDVIHSFWVPALSGKRDVIPGSTEQLRLEADAPGEYWGHCAEFCGLSHSLMRTRVMAMAPADYQTWLDNQQAPAAIPREGAQEWDGLQVYLNAGCTQCHTVRFSENDAGIESNVVPGEAFRGPELTHFASRHVFAGASLPEEGESKDHALRRWLANPPDVKPGSYMPDLNLTEQQIDDVIAWLESNQ
jgi:cytochrome c oxidase subunit 2